MQCLLRGTLIDFETIGKDGRVSRVANRQIVSSFLDQKRSSTDASLPMFSDDETAIVHYLNSGRGATRQKYLALIDAYQRLLDRHPQTLRSLIIKALASPSQLTRLTDLLPERLLNHTLQLMGMQALNKLTLWAELLGTACQAGNASLNVPSLTKVKWQALFNYMAIHGRQFNEKSFVSYFLKVLFKHSSAADKERFTVQVAQQLEKNALPSTAAVTKRVVQCVQEVAKQPLTEKAVPSTDDIELLDTLVNESDDPEILPSEDICIYNAGMVLANPYLQRLFGMLGLTEGNAFKSPQTAAHGVHILQYMVNESSETAEHELALNKLICGVKSADVMARQAEISDQEKQQVDGLLQGIIQNWSVLKNTTVTGLRETFLQREGRLQLKDDAWYLLVEPKPFDMLLDKLPWGYSTLKYPWMERVIYVEWR